MTDAYCSACGESIHPDAAVCPECGVETAQRSDGWDAEVWLGIGAIAAFVSWIAFAVVMGPLAVFAGFMAYRRGSKYGGPLVAIVGFVAFVIWAWAWLTVYGGGMA